MNKKELRQNVIVSLKKLYQQHELKQSKEAQLYAALFASKQWLDAEHIGLTYSMPIEVNTVPIIERAWDEKKKVYLPSSHPKGVMYFHPYNQKTSLKKSKFGVLEPETHVIIEKNVLDFIVVPGVIYRKDGYRIGFGGGYYDRYLADFNGKTSSLVFSEQVNESWEPDSYDIAVQKLFIQ